MGLIQRFNNRVRGSFHYPSHGSTGGNEMDDFFFKGFLVWVVGLGVFFAFIVGLLYVVKHLFFA